MDVWVRCKRKTIPSHDTFSIVSWQRVHNHDTRMTFHVPHSSFVILDCVSPHDSISCVTYIFICRISQSQLTYVEYSYPEPELIKSDPTLAKISLSNYFLSHASFVRLIWDAFFYAVLCIVWFLWLVRWGWIEYEISRNNSHNIFYRSFSEILHPRKKIETLWEFIATTDSPTYNCTIVLRICM